MHVCPLPVHQTPLFASCVQERFKALSAFAFLSLLAVSLPVFCFFFPSMKHDDFQHIGKF